MLLHEALRQLPSVANVRSLFPDHPQPLNAVFWLCPAYTGNGLTVRRDELGLTARYDSARLSLSTIDRIARTRRFATEAAAVGIKVTPTAIFAAGDAMVMFPVPADPPSPPEELDGITVASNLEAVRRRWPVNSSGCSACCPRERRRQWRPTSSLVSSPGLRSMARC